MKMLLIDTCGLNGSVALADTKCEQPIVAAATLPDRTASERLVATIRDLAFTAKLKLPSLDAVVLACGPGSFTGVRVGLSAAKGLCEALSLPLIALSRLAVISSLAPSLTDHSRLTLLDAGRGEYYLRESLNLSMPKESLATREEIVSMIEHEMTAPHSGGKPPLLILCEPGVKACFPSYKSVLVREPVAADLLPLAEQRLEREQFDDIAAIDANYLRRTDAEIFLRRGVADASAGTTVR